MSADNMLAIARFNVSPDNYEWRVAEVSASSPISFDEEQYISNEEILYWFKNAKSCRCEEEAEAEEERIQRKMEDGGYYIEYGTVNLIFDRLFPYHLVT